MFQATHRPSSGAQKLAASNQKVCKTRGCNYSFSAPDDGWCVIWNML